MDKSVLHKNLEDLKDKMSVVNKDQASKVTVGFDGFVDEIIEVVDKRQSFDNYQRMTTIEQFGKRILRSAKLSTNIELVPKIQKLGGNGPIMANALLGMGQQVSYLGALGVPDIHPVFDELVKKSVQAYSITQPGHTDALEFHDGKIMLGKLAPLQKITWENIWAKTGADVLCSLFTDVDLVATVNWTMTPYMNQIWKKLLEFLSRQYFAKRPLFFIDLADPEKRNNDDIHQALELIKAFSHFYDVVLGLNRKEASEVAKVIDADLTAGPDNVEIEEITQALADKLNLWGLVVHSVKESATVCNGEYVYTEGPFCENPKLTTGAGDNFNAGFCLGLLMEFPLNSVLTLAKATSGFYVRNGFSPNFKQLQEFADLWQNNIAISF